MVVTLPADTLARLRDALTGAAYTVDGVADLLGARAEAALRRHETTPALRRTSGGSPLDTLTRLWPLQAAVPEDSLEAALPGLAGPLRAAGVVEVSGGQARALVDIRPHANDDHDWWVAADLTAGLDGRDRRMPPDHVLGVAPASMTLAQLVVREPCGRALDLGTGSGVQALHLSTHADAVVGTDPNPRSLALARITAGLSGVDLELRAGSLFEPVAGERFDLIVSNPPFVVAPETAERLSYRDSGMPGDELSRRVVVDGARHLAPGGWLQTLANWTHSDQRPWAERVGDWVRGTGLDAWVVQREQLDPARYVEMWLDDAGLRGTPQYQGRYDAWLDWFDDQGVEAVGMGWVVMRASGRDEASVRVEDWPYEVEQPLGPHVAAWARRVDVLSAIDDATLLGASLVRASDVVEERVGPPGAADPTAIVLRTGRGMRRARQVTTSVAAFVGACDGELSVGQIADALATLLPAQALSLREELATAARALVLDEFLSFP